MEIDYLIIGQGLAGSLLAWELIQRQKKVVIIDNGKENASLIAAGLINPVTGMRFVKSSNVDQLLPSAINYYQQLSSHFKQPFYIEKPMLRILAKGKEVSACQKRLNDTDYQNYLTEIIPATQGINSSHGILKQSQTGYLLTKTLLHQLKDYFISLNCYLNNQVDYVEIKFTPILQWREFSPTQIIFCEGHHAMKNPWFSGLPFQPVKGEIITATSNQKIPPNILNYGHWFIPLNDHHFRTGATFDRENLNTKTSSQAKDTLIDSLKKVYPSLSINQIINQQAGIRPTTLDKQPFIGKHPRYTELMIFNGFGAKGSLQIPWYCQQLANHLIDNHPLPETSHIARYNALL